MNASRTAAFCALITLVLAGSACANTGAGDSDSSSGPNVGSQAIAESAGGSGSAKAPSGTTATESLKVILTTSLGLSVESVGQTYERVSDVARSAGGYVATANLTEGTSKAAAQIELRIPATRLTDVIASIKTLPGARLDTETITSKEVTGEYTDLASRLRNLERTEAQYQQFLSQAKTIDEVLNVNGRLQTTRDEIERTQGRINLIDSQVEFASLKLTLTPVVIAQAAEAKHPAPLQVLSDAWDASVLFFWFALSLGAVLLVGLAWLVPAGILSIIAMKLFRRYSGALQRLKL